MEHAMEALAWIEAMTEHPMLPNGTMYKDQSEVAAVLKDGKALCEYVQATIHLL